MYSASAMKEKTNWKKVAFITDVVELIAGVFDHIEGSLVIAVGSGLIAFSTWFAKDRHHKLFLTSFILIAIGISFLFCFSMLGGIGGKSSISIWWGLFILPYPAGWLLAIIVLLIRTFKKKKQPAL